MSKTLASEPSPTPGQEKVLRVSQLDASELDEELSELLQDQFVNLFKLLPSVHQFRVKPELRALVRFLIWQYSIQTHGQSFGQRMMDLTYSIGADQLTPIRFNQKAVLFLFMVGAEWLQERLDTICKLLLLPVRPSVLQKTLNWIVMSVKILSLGNFVMFLLSGQFPTLRERVLGLRMVPEHPQTLRQMSYEYMNREILWHGFSEFLFFVLPHFNLFAIRNWLRRYVSFGREGNVPPSGGVVALTATDFAACAFCESLPTMPYVADCGHVYCYYCLRANCLADSHFPCSACGSQVRNPAPARLKASEE